MPMLKVSEESLNYDLTMGNYEVVRALSGGYKIQTGQNNITVATAGTLASSAITFSTAFPTGCTCVLVSMISVGGGSAGYVAISASNTSVTGFTLSANSYLAQTIGIQWIAIGI